MTVGRPLLVPHDFGEGPYTNAVPDTSTTPTSVMRVRHLLASSAHRCVENQTLMPTHLGLLQ
eukprot:16461-Rhodomonas_salina.2